MPPSAPSTAEPGAVVVGAGRPRSCGAGAARGGDCGDRRRQPHQRPGEDIGENQIVGSLADQIGMADAGCRHRAQPGPGAVGAGIVACGQGRDRIDVTGIDRLLQRARGGDGEQAGAGADIEHPLRSALFQHIGEMQETAARRAVMAGAEGERRLDLDGDFIGARAMPVVAAVHHELPGTDRGQPFKRGGDPVLLVDFRKFSLLRERGADDAGQHGADHRFVRLCGKIDFQ